MHQSRIDERARDEDALLDEMKRAWAEHFRFYSNAGKERRERWVVAEFLTQLPVTFTPDELLSHIQSSKVDVEFREAHFQVKEIPDPNFRRGDDIKATYRRVMSAKTLQDTVGQGFTYDVPPLAHGYELVRDKARELASMAVYKDRRSMLDLLFYITRTRASMIERAELRSEDFSSLGWRSVSCLLGKRASVLYVSPVAPSFLVRHQGT